MRIIIEDLQPGEEEEIIIKVKRTTENILRAIELFKQPNDLTVYLDDQALLLPPSDIFYIETVDLKTFVYGENKIFKSKLKLYEIEELLIDGDFLRISKQTLLNFRKIQSVSPSGAGRFQATLINNEKVIISRQYVPKLKEVFGL